MGADGTLNGHVEEMHAGHGIVKAFGRQEEAIERSSRNEQLFQAKRIVLFCSVPTEW